MSGSKCPTLAYICPTLPYISRTILLFSVTYTPGPLQVAYQAAVREQRLAREISAAKHERDHYLAQVRACFQLLMQASTAWPGQFQASFSCGMQVDRSKALAAMAERRAAKAQQQQQRGAQDGTPSVPQGQQGPGAAPAAAEGARTQGQSAAGARGATRAAAGQPEGAAGEGPQVRNKGLRLRLPLAPLPGEAAGREVADDVLMMIAARKKRPRLNE